MKLWFAPLLSLAACIAARAAGADAPADGPKPVPPAATPSAPARVQKVEAFALVGTGSNGKDSFAFFDSADANLKQLLHPGDQIAGCTITAVAHDHVTLKSGDEVIQLPLKMQLRRENAGQWKLLEVVENFTPSPRPENEPASGSRSFSGGPTASFSPNTPRPAGEISEKAIKKLESQIASDLKAAEKFDKEMKGPKDGGGGKPDKKPSKRSRRE